MIVKIIYILLGFLSIKMSEEVIGKSKKSSRLNAKK